MKEYSIPLARSDTVLLVALSAVLITSGSRNTLTSVTVIMYMEGGQLVSLVGGGSQDNSTELAISADEVVSPELAVSADEVVSTELAVSADEVVSTELAVSADIVVSTGALGVFAVGSFHLYMHYKLIELHP